MTDHEDDPLMAAAADEILEAISEVQALAAMPDGYTPPEIGEIAEEIERRLKLSLGRLGWTAEQIQSGIEDKGLAVGERGGHRAPYTRGGWPG